MARVVRILVYEGDEKSLRENLAGSLPLGTKVLPSHTITVYEHSNDLPKFWGLHPEEVKETIAKGVKQDDSTN